MPDRGIRSGRRSPGLSCLRAGHATREVDFARSRLRTQSPGCDRPLGLLPPPQSHAGLFIERGEAGLSAGARLTLLNHLSDQMAREAAVRIFNQAVATAAGDQPDWASFRLGRPIRADLQWRSREGIQRSAGGPS